MDPESTPQFSSLIDLFEAMNIVEKGIEQVYDYLLKNQKVDDLKILEDNLGLNQKRIYKICSVLKDLGLIQIYNRPMKLQLMDPKSSWQKIIQDKINEIKNAADEKINACHLTFEKMAKAYNLTDIKEQPVEFISFLGDLDLDSQFYSLLSEKESCIAHGIWYKFEFERIIEAIKKDEDSRNELIKIFNSIRNNNFKVLLSEEYIENIDKNFEEYQQSSDLFKKIGINDLNFDIRISEEQFSNFSVMDNKILIQPSFDPSDNLIGFFVSTPQEIVNVFNKKFHDLFEKAKPLIVDSELKSNNLKFYQLLLSI